MAIRTDNVGVQALLNQAQSKLTAGTSTQTSSGSESTAAEKVRKLAPSLVAAHDRIAAQAQAASTSLSVMGQFKSSLVDLGAAGKDLSALSGTSTPEAVRGALEKFVARYNASTVKGTGGSADGTSSDVGVSRALRELRAALSDTGASSPSLARLGISQGKDATLSLDVKALDKALSADATGIAAALATMGKAVEAAADSTLASGSRLSSSITSAGNRAQQLQEQETALVNTATKLGQAYGTTSLAASWNRQVLDAYLKN